MNCTKIVKKLAESTGLPKSRLKALVAEIIDTIVVTLAKGQKVRLHGLGAFRVETRSARTGINPRTKEKIQVPAKRIVKFKAGKNLKAAMSK